MTDESTLPGPDDLPVAAEDAAHGPSDEEIERLKKEGIVE